MKNSRFKLVKQSIRKNVRAYQRKRPAAGDNFLNFRIFEFMKNAKSFNKVLRTNMVKFCKLNRFFVSLILINLRATTLRE